MESADKEKALVFRSTAARVCGWAWLVFAAANLVDVAFRGRDAAALVAVAFLLLGSGIAYVLGLRPRIVADSSGIRVHNPLRDVVVPWSALIKVTAADTLRFTYTGPGGEPQESVSWLLQTSPRARAKQARRSAHHPDQRLGKLAGSRTPADFAAQQLTELAARHRGTAGNTAEATAEAATGRVGWSLPAVAALAVPTLLVAAALLFANLN